MGVIVRVENDRRMTLMDPGRAGVPNRGEPHSGGKGPPRSCSTESCCSGGGYLDPLCPPEWDGSHLAPLGSGVRAPRWRMRPAGDSGSARRVTPSAGNDAMRRSTVRPLLVEGRRSSLRHRLQNRMYDLDGRPCPAEPAESSRR